MCYLICFYLKAPPQVLNTSAEKKKADRPSIAIYVPKPRRGQTAQRTESSEAQNNKEESPKKDKIQKSNRQNKIIETEISEF